jgi:hypothetical protein
MVATYDAILILGGSFIDEKTLPEWVEKRIDAAIQLNSSCTHYLILSGGSPHKPPCIRNNGHPISECDIMANYMIEKNINPKKILLDSWSMDTIGNAYAALMMHCVPRNLRNLLVITSDFHMPRSRSIFEKVFSLFPIDIFNLEFLASDSSLSISDKERKSLETWEITKNNIKSLVELHEFIFEKHEIYNSIEYKNKTYDKNDSNMKMYCL